MGTNLDWYGLDIYDFSEGQFREWLSGRISRTKLFARLDDMLDTCRELARQRRAHVASVALASPSLAASVHNCAAGSVASVARSAATGSSIRVAVTAAIAGHHRGADTSR